LEYLDVDGKEVLECIIGKRMRGCGLGSSGLGWGPVASPCEQGNEPSVSIKKTAITAADIPPMN